MTHPDNSQQVDAEALIWATRLDAGLTPADETALAAWLAAHPSHEWRLAHHRRFFAQLHDTVPTLAREASASAARVSRPAGRLLRVWAVGGAVAAALVLGVCWFALRPQEFATLSAQRQNIVLPDGSSVDLNARTHLSVRLRGAERRIQLESGEAYFEVAKDPARPFFVATPSGTVRVTGTKFNVRTAADGSLAVTVLEGSVAVATAGHEFRLKPNDQVSLEGGLVTEVTLPAAAADDVIAWREGKVVFDDTPLAVAAARFAAYHGRTLTVSPEAGGLLLGGRYTLDDFEQFIVSVEQTLPVRALRGENGAVRLVAAGNNPAPR